MCLDDSKNTKTLQCWYMEAVWRSSATCCRATVLLLATKSCTVREGQFKKLNKTSLRGLCNSVLKVQYTITWPVASGKSVGVFFQWFIQIQVQNLLKTVDGFTILHPTFQNHGQLPNSGHPLVPQCTDKQGSTILHLPLVTASPCSSVMQLSTCKYKNCRGSLYSPQRSDATISEGKDLA